MVAMGRGHVFSLMFCFPASFTATATIDERRLLMLSFVGHNPAAFTPLCNDLATGCLKNPQTYPFQLYLNDELDEDQKPDESQRETTALQVKERLKLANEAVAMAFEGVAMAEAGVVKAEASVVKAEAGVVKAEARVVKAEARVVKAEAELDQWNKLAKSKLTDPDMLSVDVTVRDMARGSLDKAMESLDKAMESLDNAMESLDKAREFYLKMIQAADSDDDRIYESSAFLRGFHEVQRQKGSVQSFAAGALGEAAHRKLERIGAISDAPIVKGEDAFWSEEIQNQATSISDEATFHAFITPFFEEALASCGLVFINSETYRWLAQSPFGNKRTFLKPHGFATHPGMYRSNQEPNDGIYSTNGFRFGVEEEELFDCIILFESELTISSDAFGQVVRYLKNVEFGGAILFDRRSFWLITSEKGAVSKVVKAMWVKHGSKVLFRNFINDNKSLWITRLIAACNLLNVEVLEGDAFLGRGAFGRVFKVKRGKEVVALKIVEECSVDGLYDEEGALARAQHTDLTIRAVGKCVEIPHGAALLLSPVGRPLPRPTTTREVFNLFELLWQLHMKGLVHGDPRVPNVILDGEKPLWIDLVDDRKACPALRVSDAENLTRCMLHFPEEELLDEELKQVIAEYGNRPTHENLLHLVIKVCRRLVFSK